VTETVLVSEQERNEFFAQFFNATDDKTPIVERRKDSGGFVIPEYRSRPRPRHWTPAQIAAWVDELQRGGWPED
jgi:hypothetical protein